MRIPQLYVINQLLLFQEYLLNVTISFKTKIMDSTIHKLSFFILLFLGYICNMVLPVKNKEELIQRILDNRQTIRQYGVKQLGFFGSFVRNEAKEDSDVDFFVEFEPEKKTFDNFMSLVEILEDITKRKIELLTPQSLSKYIGKYILKEVEYVPLAA